MSGLAVLLIIGSAVIGPVEAQTVGDTAKAEQACYDAYTSKNPISEIEGIGRNQRVVRSWRDACPASKFVHTYETLPQLCERAMREIGATKDGVIKGGTVRVQGAMGYHYAPAEQAVFCIPVPQGYRK